MPMALPSKDSGNASIITKGGSEENGKLESGEEGRGGEEEEDLDAVQDLSVPKRANLSEPATSLRHSPSHFDGKSPRSSLAFFRMRPRYV